MPVLKFRLGNRRLILDATPSTEEWKLVFDAVNQPVDDGQSFKILSRGNEYDAYGITGTDLPRDPWTICYLRMAPGLVES